MKRSSILLVVLSSVFLISCQKISHIFLPPLKSPDVRLVLPAPPLPGSAAQEDDNRVFHKTRALKDTPRWTLAQHDSDLSHAVLLHDFSCAIGYQLTLSKAPHLDALLDRVQKTVKQRTHEAKQYWHRQRPFVGTTAPTCTATDTLNPHASYPSGHATAGYSLALILARLAPDRAGKLLQRGRTFGESRIICGVHWKSDVQNGYLNAATQMAALLTANEIQDDLQKAQRELLDMKKTAAPPDREDCAREEDAAKHSIFSEQ